MCVCVYMYGCATTRLQGLIATSSRTIGISGARCIDNGAYGNRSRLLAQVVKKRERVHRIPLGFHIFLLNHKVYLGEKENTS